MAAVERGKLKALTPEEVARASPLPRSLWAAAEDDRLSIEAGRPLVAWLWSALGVDPERADAIAEGTVPTMAEDLATAQRYARVSIAAQRAADVATAQRAAAQPSLGRARCALDMGGDRWEGYVRDFLAENEDLAWDEADCIARLSPGSFVEGGGGAAPRYRITRLPDGLSTCEITAPAGELEVLAALLQECATLTTNPGRITDSWGKSRVLAPGVLQALVEAGVYASASASGVDVNFDAVRRRYDELAAAAGRPWHEMEDRLDEEDPATSVDARVLCVRCGDYHDVVAYFTPASGWKPAAARITGLCPKCAALGVADPQGLAQARALLEKEIDRCKGTRDRVSLTTLRQVLAALGAVLVLLTVPGAPETGGHRSAAVRGSL